MPFPRLSRLACAFMREIVDGRLPHGLLGWRYLFPARDPRIRLHRRLWWESGNRWPRPIWLAVQAWLWLRWVTWHALPTCWRATRRYGRAVEAAEDIPRWRQGLRVARLALAWCIPPWESYEFRLYRAPDKALDYVYGTETQAYHAWRNKSLGVEPASLRLIQDKLKLAGELSKLGVSMAPTLAAATAQSGTTPLWEQIRQHGRVFCKTNSGYQGRGAFAAWKTQHGLAGSTLTGQALPDTEAVERAWAELLALDTALIQPRLENHPTLAPLAYGDEAITVRFISQWETRNADSRLACLNATLEVPAGKSSNGYTCYGIFPIQPEIGKLLPQMEALYPEEAVRHHLLRVQSLAGAVSVLPCWERLLAETWLAHAHFPDIRAIAWDWVITPHGPVLLEGNTGWSTSTEQILQGGFCRQ